MRIATAQNGGMYTQALPPDLLALAGFLDPTWSPPTAERIGTIASFLSAPSSDGWDEIRNYMLPGGSTLQQEWQAFERRMPEPAAGFPHPIIATALIRRSLSRRELSLADQEQRHVADGEV